MYGIARQAKDDGTAMRIACWIIKTTNTHSAYVILIAFRHQQWLQERTLPVLFSITFKAYSLLRRR